MWVVSQTPDGYASGLCNRRDHLVVISRVLSHRGVVTTSDPSFSLNVERGSEIRKSKRTRPCSHRGIQGSYTFHRFGAGFRLLVHSAICLPYSYYAVISSCVDFPVARVVSCHCCPRFPARHKSSPTYFPFFAKAILVTPGPWASIELGVEDIVGCKLRRCGATVWMETNGSST